MQFQTELSNYKSKTKTRVDGLSTCSMQRVIQVPNYLPLKLITSKTSVTIVVNIDCGRSLGCIDVDLRDELIKYDRVWPSDSVTVTMSHEHVICVN